MKSTSAVVFFKSKLETSSGNNSDRVWSFAFGQGQLNDQLLEIPSNPAFGDSCNFWSRHEQ